MLLTYSTYRAITTRKLIHYNHPLQLVITPMRKFINESFWQATKGFRFLFVQKIASKNLRLQDKKPFYLYLFSPWATTVYNWLQIQHQRPQISLVNFSWNELAFNLVRNLFLLETLLPWLMCLHRHQKPNAQKHPQIPTPYCYQVNVKSSSYVPKWFLKKANISTRLFLRIFKNEWSATWKYEVAVSSNKMH